MFKNPKGMELAIGTVTILAILLIVLIVVSGFFLSGFGEGGGGIQDILGGASDEAKGTDVSSRISTMFPKCGDGIGDEHHCCETENTGATPSTFTYAWVNEGTCTGTNEAQVRSSKCSNIDFTCSSLKTKKIITNCGKCIPTD